MTAQEFVIWLKGVLTTTTQPNQDQWKLIKSQIDKVADVPQIENQITIPFPNKELLKD